MLINEVCKQTHLTKKAVEYYIQQGLIAPAVLENGYRDFSSQDVETLGRIWVLRKLGIGVEEMKAVLAQQDADLLQSLAVRKELDIRREQQKEKLLNGLSQGESYEKIRIRLTALCENETIAERLLEAFPGYYGRYICLHFSRFLNEPIVTENQRKAYGRVLDFLDRVPAMEMSKEVEEYFEESTKHISREQIDTMLDQMQESVENPKAFLSENEEILKEYLAYKQSEEYKKSPAYQLEIWLQKFNSTSGYDEVFLPALKELSPSYAAYCKKLEEANEILLKEYPELKAF